MTVTVWATFQLAAVKVRLPAETVPSVASLDDMPIVTSAVGWLFSTTVNVAVPPASVVLPLIAETVIPAASLSRLVTATSAAFTAVVVRVGAGGRGGDDRVGDVAVLHEIVHAGDRHRLGHVPVGGGEGQAAGGDRAFGRVAGLDRPIVTSAVGWLFSTTVNVAVPPASVVLPLIAETLMPAVSLSRLVTATSAASQAVVVRVGAGRRRGDDRVADVAVLHGVVHAGDRHRLGHVPVGGREGQAAGGDRAFGRVAGREADRHVGRGLAVQHHGERGRAAGFGRVRPLIAETVIPAVSLSVLVTATSAALRPL